MSIVRAAARGIARVRNDAPVPLVSRRSSSGGSTLGAGGAASPTELAAQLGKSSTLYSVISRTSSALRDIDWSLYQVPTDGKRDPGEDRDPITVHPAWQLLQYPNPFMSWDDILEGGQQWLDLVGETILVVTKAGNIPMELWPIRPDRMTPVPDARKFLAGWIYRDPDGDKIPLNVDEVIQVKYPNPLDPYRGMGPVQTLLATIDSDRYSAEWNRNFFLNSAEPGGIIQVPGHLSDTQWEEFTSRWQEQHRGVDRAHRVAVIEHDATYVPRSFTQRDMQFRELRELARDTVYEAFGISRATMGATDGVNYAAARAARDQFAELLTMPRLSRWRAALNGKLLPMFEPERKPGQPRVRTVEFDYEDPRDGDPDQDNAERDSRVNAVSVMLSIPTVKFDVPAVLEAFGLPDIPFEEVEPPPIMLPPGAAPPGGTGAPEPPPGGGSGAAEKDSRGGEPAPSARAALVRAEGVPDVDLTQHAADHEQALERLMDRWDSVRAAWRSELTQQIRDAVDAGNLAALGSLTCDSEQAATVIGEAREALARKSWDQVREQASEAGVDLPRWQARHTARVTNEADDTADVLAALLAAAEALSAGTEAIRISAPGKTGDQVAGQVGKALREQEGKQAESQLSGSLTGAQNRARIDAYRSGPIASLYADETLDKNTCPPCRAINGRFIATTEDGNAPELERLYPGMGGYVDCEGRWRCRGTVTGVWRPEQDTGGDQT